MLQQFHLLTPPCMDNKVHSQWTADRQCFTGQREQQLTTVDVTVCICGLARMLEARVKAHQHGVGLREFVCAIHATNKTVSVTALLLMLNNGNS